MKNEKTIQIYNGDGFKAFSLREMSDQGWTIEGADKTRAAELYRQTAWLYSVITKRGAGVQSIPRVLKKGQTKVSESDLPFKFDIGDLMRRSSIALDLYAKAYLLVVRNQFKPLKVRWLYPESIELKIDEVRGLEGFKRTVGAKDYPYGYDQAKDISPDGLTWIWATGMPEVGPGIPKADVAKYPAMVLRAIDQHTTKFFSSAAIGQIYFTSKNVPLKSERNRFRKWAKRMLFKGLETAFSAEVFGSDLTPHKLSTDPADLAMSDLDADNRRDVSAIFDTPEALITGEAGGMSRATLDRITSNWLLGPVMQQATLIVDSYNHHILHPAGYELTLNPENLSVNQEEEKQRATAVSMYINAGFNPKWVAGALGLDGPADVPMMAPKPVMLPSVLPAPSEPEPDSEPAEDDNDKSIERARLRRWIKNGKHLKRAFHSDVLTLLEIEREVDKFQDAPFRAVKQTPIQVGDEEIDPELKRYYEEIEVLAERARRGQVTRSSFESELTKLMLAAIALAFLLGGGDEEIEGASAALEEQRRVGRESVDALADDIYDGAFAEDDHLGRTDADGKDKLATRMALWAGTMAAVYATSQIHKPPSLNDEGETVEQNYVWRLGNTVEHCVDCLSLDGQSHSASEWRRAGISPRHFSLSCGGWNCDCRFEATDLESIGMNF